MMTASSDINVKGIAMHQAHPPADLPRAPACARNREPILAVLKAYLRPGEHVLEIGSGTGEHAVYFAEQLPELTWQPTERPEHLPGVEAWVEWARLGNLARPLMLDVTARWPVERVDAVFSANTAHIMSWEAVEAMFLGVGAALKPGGYFLLYGPFNYGGRYTSESNRHFDETLRRRDPAMGLRDVADLERLAQRAGLERVNDHAMPANNRVLVWRHVWSES